MNPHIFCFFVGVKSIYFHSYYDMIQGLPGWCQLGLSLKRSGDPAADDELCQRDPGALPWNSTGKNPGVRSTKVVSVVSAISSLLKFDIV